jgi:hypothetical protein
MTLAAVYQVAGIVPYVTVASASESLGRGGVQSIMLSFSGPIDPVTARNRKAYWIVLPGRDGVFGTRDDRFYRFRSVTYSAAANRVRLLPSIRLSTRRAFEVIAKATGSAGMLTDIYARPIDGNHDGQPGGDYVAAFGPGTSALRLAARGRVLLRKPRSAR